MTVAEPDTQAKVYEEADYAAALDDVCDDLIHFLTVGDSLGKTQQGMSAEFIGRFQKAAAEVFGE